MPVFKDHKKLLALSVMAGNTAADVPPFAHQVGCLPDRHSLEANLPADRDEAGVGSELCPSKFTC